MPAARKAELVFVVDVTALTENGFVGTSGYEGGTVALGFDDKDEGVFLSREMAARLGVKEGSKVYIVMEGDGDETVEARLTAVGGAPRISNPRVYRVVGREGGAVVRRRRP